jgi:hypothetical protein
MRSRLDEKGAAVPIQHSERDGTTPHSSLDFLPPDSQNLIFTETLFLNGR